MEIIKSLFDFIMHIDEHLIEMVSNYGNLVYLILFLIIFVETGVVVMPFLPGDSLLFAAGMLAAQANGLNLWVLMGILFAAAVLGDSLNYFIGSQFGMRVTKFKLFGKQMVKDVHIEKTNHFYEKYGSKTIVIARFVPIVRTLAPFVGGIGSMHYRTFITYNIIGAALWVFGVTLAGYFLGNIPIIRDNFEKVIFGIIFLSILPIIWQIAKSKFGKKEEPAS